MNKLRVFTAFFVSSLVFFFLYSFIAWLLTNFGITPYGKFVATFFKGRNPEEAKVFIAANQELFSKMLPAAVKFSNLVINPFVGLVTGTVAGLIIPTKKPSVAVIWSLVFAIPVFVLFWAKTGSDPLKAIYLGVLLIAFASGGFAGNRIISKIVKDKEGVDVQIG